METRNALVPVTRPQTRALVVTAIRSALTEPGQSIGVSTNWLVKHVEALALREEEVQTLVAVRTEFGGLLPHAVKFLYEGLTTEDVYGCYRAQRLLVNMGNKTYNASVKKIAMLIRAFPEADPDNEDLSEIIAEAHNIISDRYFWVRYVDQSISILCAIADTYGCSTIDAALAMVDSRHPKEDGVVASDDEEDEVERHRTAHEHSRRN